MHKINRSYQAYLIDLDGTIYAGERRIPTAERFIKTLQERGLPFRIITNNATVKPEVLVETLAKHHHIQVDVENIYTSTMALIDYLKRVHPNDTFFVIGESALQTSLLEAGLSVADSGQAQHVVQGLSRQVDYQQLSQAVRILLAGGEFLVTNMDRLIPTKDGFFPSSGAITSFIAYASQVQPKVFGKPHRPIVEGALASLNQSVENCLLIGDNYETDIQAGIQVGMDTLMVLTGVSQRSDLEGKTNLPTYVVNDLSEWGDGNWLNTVG